MSERPTRFLACLLTGLLLTAAVVIVFGQWRIYLELEAWRVQQAATDARLIELKSREVCVLWLSGDQRAEQRGKAGTAELTTWNDLCGWMEGIRP